MNKSGFLILRATIRGSNDDINLFKSVKTTGLIIRPFKILLIPKL